VKKERKYYTAEEKVSILIKRRKLPHGRFHQGMAEAGNINRRPLPGGRGSHWRTKTFRTNRVLKRYQTITRSPNALMRAGAIARAGERFEIAEPGSMKNTSICHALKNI